MAVYTTVAEVAALRGYGEFTVNTRPTLAEVELFIVIIAAEMETVVLMNYVLPITEAAHPIAYTFLKLINQLGTTMMIFDSVNATISDPTQREKNTWRKLYEDRLKRLHLVNSLPGVDLIEIWDYPFGRPLGIPDPVTPVTPETPLEPSMPVTPVTPSTVKIAFGWSLDTAIIASELTAKTTSNLYVIPALPGGRDFGLWGLVDGQQRR